MKKSPNLKRLDRRQFLKTAGAAIILPTLLPGCATGGGHKKLSANGKVNLGVVGWGMQGPGDTKSFLVLDDCRVIAACDLDKNHLQSAVDTINGHYQNNDCAAYHDYREMMARPDLDAVLLAVPDHWHALVATEAARRKLDTYGEKPLARTIVEQQAIVRAVEKNKTIWQTGSWQRSEPTFHKAAEIVRNGLIGDVTHCEVGLPAGHFDFAGTVPELLQKFASLPDKVTDLTTVTPGSAAWNLAVTDPPTELDFERWIGPSKMEPYIKQRVHMNWRWNYNTGGGQLLDWIGHHCDIAHWGLGFDRSGPSEVEGHGDFPPADAIWNTTGKYRIQAFYDKNVTNYPVDVHMTIAGGYDEIRSGVKWIGTTGWVWVDRGGFDASNKDWKKGKSLPEDLRKIKLYESPGHWRNFIDCVKSRQPTICPAETGHHSTIPGHLGLISMLTGRKIKWSVKHEKILDDSAASALLSRPYRAPYHLA